MEDVKVSILIPVYNGENYIQKCVKSILRQTFQAYETVIVDDGSADSTERKVRELVEHDNRFRYIKIPHRGVSAARQEALLQAKGDYIIFVDSDDWIESDMIEAMYRQCMANQVDGVCAGIIHDMRTHSAAYVPADKPGSRDALLFLKAFYRKQFVATLTSYMLKRDLWEGFVFPENISVGEDMAGLVYVLGKADQIYAMDKAYYHYCQHEGSIVHSGLSEGKINAYYYEKEMMKKVLKLIPDCRNAIEAWYAQDKIYLLSAMGRSRDFHKEIAGEITKDFRAHFMSYLQNRYLDLPYKASVLVIAVSAGLYDQIYRFVFHHIGWIYKWVSRND